MLPHVDLLPLFTLPSPFLLPMRLDMGGVFNGPNFWKNSFSIFFCLSFFPLSSVHCIECTLFATVLDIILISQVLNFIAC